MASLSRPSYSLPPCHYDPPPQVGTFFFFFASVLLVMCLAKLKKPPHQTNQEPTLIAIIFGGERGTRTAQYFSLRLFSFFRSRNESADSACACAFVVFLSLSLSLLCFFSRLYFFDFCFFFQLMSCRFCLHTDRAM